jgi:catecholate siderophore receptor
VAVGYRVENKFALRAALLSVSTLALGLSFVAYASDARAQSAAEARPGATSLPPVSVDPVRRKPRRARATTTSRQAAPAAVAQTQAKPLDTQEARSGTIGYLATRTSSATKTNTALINVPQSVTVLTKDFLKDTGSQSVSEAIRYVPGLVPAQGEGNRDQLVIRGQNTTADFFVDGLRDDVQYYRDFYNIQSIEVLKGPNAMIFGRGGGGGVINRITKEADGRTIREVTVQGGSYDNKRVSIDAGGAVDSNVAGRINAMYEKSGSFRDHVDLERYGINPTVTIRGEDTKVKLSYEYFHDERTADRGIPSYGTGTAARPAGPFQTSPSTFFGNPDLSFSRADAHIANAVIEHDFNNGLTVKSASQYSNFDKFYQNVFASGAVNPGTQRVALGAYNNATKRENVFNQTDWTYRTNTGPVLHTLVFGTEIGRQTTDSLRNSGSFPGGNTVPASNPTTFAPVNFFHAANDANSLATLNLASAYVQDQMEITRYFQVIAGVRFDRFDLTSLNRNAGGTTSNRVDNLVSPRVGLVFKPVENVSVYGSYSTSYLPSSGDQFSSLTPQLAVTQPEKFINTEVGVKWDIAPRTQFTAAVYDLDRENQRFTDTFGNILTTGKTKTRGAEVAVTGYVTDQWQITGGYAYTDSRITSDNSLTIVKGNRVGLVPYNTFTMWNRYQIDEMWGAGVGVIHYGNSYASSDDTVRLPAFTRVDAALYFRLNQNWRAQLNVENIFDVGYYATAHSNVNISPGAPRTFRVSATANF